MTFRITCYTLFDITQTGVPNRSKPANESETKNWTHKRNTQCNFDTVLQAISLRSQPESITNPKKIDIKFDESHKFGFLYTSENEVNCWVFDFEINHPSVFDDGIEELGALYNDCDGIPMIKCGTEYDKLSNFLDTTPELRNIYFVKYKNEP